MLSASISFIYLFFFSSRRRHTRCSRDWSSDVCSSDLSSFHGRVLLRLRGDDSSWPYLLDCGALFSSRSKSAVSAANFALATVLFGCMTMSHPAGVSSRWQRTISRRRRRIRLRTTAPPSVFLMLNPNRLCGCSLARKKTVKWELERRFPARYTASNSDFRTRRASRGNVARRGSASGGVTELPGLFGGKPMASLLAARRQYPATAFRFHARAESVRLGAPALARLKCALWQSNPPL